MEPRDQKLVLLGKVTAGANILNSMCSIKKGKGQPKAREHQKTSYFLEGGQLCRATFKFIHGLVLQKTV